MPRFSHSHSLAYYNYSGWNGTRLRRQVNALRNTWRVIILRTSRVFRANFMMVGWPFSLFFSFSSRCFIVSYCSQFFVFGKLPTVKQSFFNVILAAKAQTKLGVYKSHNSRKGASLSVRFTFF